MRSALLLTTTLAVAVLVACGDDADRETVGSTTDPTTSTAVTTSTTALPVTTAPATTAVPAQPSDGDLDGTSYTADALTVDGTSQPAVAGTVFTISFADGRVVAEAGCNTGSGSYRVEDGRLVVSRMVSTTMGCAPELEVQDALLAELLQAGPSMTIAGNALTLSTERITFTGTSDTAAGSAPSLDGRTFVADSLTVDGVEQPAVSGSSISIEFGPLVVTAQAGCNVQSAGYRLQGDLLLLDEWMMTAMSCGPELDAQDELVRTLLTTDPTATMNGDTLVLDGGRVRFVGIDREVADPDRPLAGTTWLYNGLIDPTTASITPLQATVVFGEDGTVTVSACRQATGTYHLDVDQITIELAPAQGEACAGSDEDVLLARLAGDATVTIEGANARLVDDDGVGVMLRDAEA